MTKKELRQLYKTKRKALSTEEMEHKSLAIANQSLKIPIWDHDLYHIFLSIDAQKEVNTQFILHILSGKDKTVTVSKSDFSTRQMKHYLLTDNTRLRLNPWGIPEPENGITITPDQIDVVFVPLLAFDLNGHRTGYGQGFYDRFLEKCRDDVLKIGLSFFEAVDTDIEKHDHDIALDYCLTPERIYSF